MDTNSTKPTKQPKPVTERKMFRWGVADALSWRAPQARLLGEHDYVLGFRAGRNARPDSPPERFREES